VNLAPFYLVFIIYWRLFFAEFSEAIQHNQLKIAV